MPYFTYKKDVPLAPGEVLAFTKGKGYYAKGGSGVTAPTGVTSSLYATALKLAQQAEQPTLDAINAERERAAKESAASVTNAQGFTDALSKLYSGIAPEIQKTYDTAAGATAGFGKGFSAAEEAIRNGDAANLGEFLQKTGAPSDVIAGVQQKAAPSGLGDVEYGLNGYIPAAGLEREGAGFTAAAKMLPAMAAGQGQMTIAQLLKQGADQNFQYGQQAATELGKIPGSARSILNDIISQANAQRSMDIQDAYLNNTQRNTTANLTGVDPVTGQPTYSAATKAQAAAAARTADRGKSVKARESAFAQAQVSLFDDAKALTKAMTTDDRINWLVQHPGSKLSDAPASFAPPYAVAAKQLFDKYKFLLRYASRSGQPALKKRLNQIIADALAAAGIHPAAPRKAKKPPTVYGPTQEQAAH